MQKSLHSFLNQFLIEAAKKPMENMESQGAILACMREAYRKTRDQMSVEDQFIISSVLLDLH
jgi:hypothetical protein